MPHPVAMWQTSYLIGMHVYGKPYLHQGSRPSSGYTDIKVSNIAMQYLSFPDLSIPARVSLNAPKRARIQNAHVSIIFDNSLL